MAATVSRLICRDVRHAQMRGVTWDLLVATLSTCCISQAKASWHSRGSFRRAARESISNLAAQAILSKGFFTHAYTSLEIGHRVGQNFPQSLSPQGKLLNHNGVPEVSEGGGSP